MIKKVVIATANPNKVEEIKEIAGDIGIEFVCAPEGFGPVENGETFMENAYIKAREAALMTGMYALGDDSGLCVDAMGGAPGLYSSRFEKTAKIWHCLHRFFKACNFGKRKFVASIFWR